VRQQEVQLLVVAALATTMIPVNKNSQQKYSIASAAETSIPQHTNINPSTHITPVVQKSHLRTSLVISVEAVFDEMMI
jgi:hypothetical protein